MIWELRQKLSLLSKLYLIIANINIYKINKYILLEESFIRWEIINLNSIKKRNKT